ncbi:XRE family transcriptional regulator [Xanthobacter sp. TB0139]|uniref:XRE family transcriptional regulator n=1 Tax=Xanthobacter sp. TB0139 TaxID=3459178 RepID=UPI004039E93F
MSLAENLKRIREQAGLSQVNLAKAARVSQQLISRLENGKDSTTKKLPDLATALGVPISALDPAYVPEPIEGITRVPRLSWISAGALQAYDPVAVHDDCTVIAVAGLPDGDWIALKVTGDSMDRISPPESIILVNRADTALVANACYVIADEMGNATYKRYRPNPTRFEPVSVNPRHEPIYPDNDPIIIGRVRRTILEM